MPKYDVACNECSWEGEISRKYSDQNPRCARCGATVRTVWKKFPKTDKASDPYDYLDKPIPSGKKVFSGPKVSSKTTVGE